MKRGKIFKILISIVICELAGIIGSFFTTPSIAQWYKVLVKPALTPPAWVFGPVWVILFALMGTAAGIVWSRGLREKGIKKALIIFDFQLALNLVWSAVFFGLRSPSWAFVVIILLWLAILAAIFYFYKISRPATYLLAPYILWVSFAVYLNGGIIYLN